MEEVDPGGQNWPAGAEQLRHVALPADVVYSPTPHSEHGASPVDVLCFPATHCMHSPPSGPLDPLLHIQSLRELLPDGDDDRGGQLEHVLDVVAPEVAEYVPAAQRTQDAEPGELKDAEPEGPTVCVWTRLKSPSPMRVPATTRTEYVPFGTSSFAIFSKKLHVLFATPISHVTLATKQLKLASVAIYVSTR